MRHPDYKDIEVTIVVNGEPLAEHDPPDGEPSLSGIDVVRYIQTVENAQYTTIFHHPRNRPVEPSV